MAKYLRRPEYGGKYRAGADLQEEAEAYNKALIAAAAKAGLRFSRGSYVRPHLVRKHLILLDYKSEHLLGKAQRLSLRQLQALKLPDEQGHLETISSYLCKPSTLFNTFCCHALFLNCFSCLARGVLQQHGAAALTYAEDPENFTRITEFLVQYRDKNHFNPSLERLFQLLLGDPGQQNTQLAAASSETEAEQEAKPKQRGKPKGLKRSQADSPDQRPGKSSRRGSRAAASESQPAVDMPKFIPAKLGGGRGSSVQSRQFPADIGTAKPAFRRLSCSSRSVIVDLAEEDDLPLLPGRQL